MRKIVWTFGIIAGLITVAMFIINIPANGAPVDFENGMLYGYITMLVALSTIFFAASQYRKKYTNGHLKFGKAFLIGLYISLIASGIYTLGWEIYYSNYATDFVEQYLAFQREQLLESGLSEAEVQADIADQEGSMALYKENRFFRLGMTFMEIFPVGLLVSLIVAALFALFLKPKSETATV